jgi:hypothetical protein
MKFPKKNDAEKGENAAEEATEAVLSEAQLTTIPDGIFKLCNLRVLDLSRNYGGYADVDIYNNTNNGADAVAPRICSMIWILILYVLHVTSLEKPKKSNQHAMRLLSLSERQKLLCVKATAPLVAAIIAIHGRRQARKVPPEFAWLPSVAADRGCLQPSRSQRRREEATIANATRGKRENVRRARCSQDPPSEAHRPGDRLTRECEDTRARSG